MQESADIFIRVLEGKGSVAQEDVVCANAALAIQCVKPHLSLPDVLEAARESLHSKRAFHIFKQLVNN
jgi:anthranilate phosphoribosyltransferase